MCMHITILLSCFATNTAIATTGAPDNLSVTSAVESTSYETPETSNELTKQTCTLLLAEKIRALPYVLPPDLLQ